MLHPEALILIDQVRRLSYKPNDWEAGFIQSIELQNPNRPLTYKQTIAMENIYKKAAGGGNYEKKQYSYRRF